MEGATNSMNGSIVIPKKSHFKRGIKMERVV